MLELSKLTLKSYPMSFFDLFKSRENREKLSHLKNLVAIAYADGKLEKSELAAIAVVMEARGINPDYLERCIKNPKGIDFVIPESYEKRLEYVKDMVFLMMVDGSIHEREMNICKLTAAFLGIGPEIINDMVSEIISNLTSSMEYNKSELQILYFYAKSKMSDNQDALLYETPLKVPMKRIDLDKDEVLQFKYEVRAWPAFILIDSKGNELHRWQGLTKVYKINDYIEKIWKCEKE